MNKPIMSSFRALWSLGGLVGASIGGFLAAFGLGVIAFCMTMGEGTLADWSAHRRHRVDSEPR